MKSFLANKNKYNFRKGQNALFFEKKLENGIFFAICEIGHP